MTSLDFLMQWYQQQCDGDWEHQYGIRIGTVDNPGWSIEVDLADTDLEGVSIDYRLVQIDDGDWYGFSASGALFRAAGDPTKLDVILRVFRSLVEDSAASRSGAMSDPGPDKQ